MINRYRVSKVPLGTTVKPGCSEASAMINRYRVSRCVRVAMETWSLIGFDESHIKI